MNRLHHLFAGATPLVLLAASAGAQAPAAKGKAAAA